MVIALIDADVLLYRIGFTTENDDEFIAKARIDDLIDYILMETGAREYELWLSDNKEGNFRYAIWPKYKANRVQPRPRHYEFLKEHIVKEWKAKIALGMEADDALGIAGCKSSGTVICSIDKDLLQIPTEHFNFVRKEWQTVTPWEGKKWFYKQMLIGDVSDNIRGCTGVGPVKASRAIDPIYPQEGEQALYQKVLKTYQKYEEAWSQQEILDHIRLVGKLLKILTTESEIENPWEPPSPPVPPTADAKLSSTPQTQEAPILSTVPTSQVEMPVNGSSPSGLQKESSSLVERAPST